MFLAACMSVGATGLVARSNQEWYNWGGIQLGDFNRIKMRNERVIMYGGRYIGRALDRVTRPVAPTFSPDGYDGNGRIMGELQSNQNAK